MYHDRIQVFSLATLETRRNSGKSYLAVTCGTVTGDKTKGKATFRS